jgi:tetratricopeptide (TPR) repeat protein
LYSPPISGDRRAQLDEDLARARAEYDAMPGNEDRAIWYGRRLAYLGRYREAIAVFTKGLDANPGSAKLRRHRGHRYITIRELDKAIADLSAAAELVRGVPDEIEPDGAPNARGIPRSTTHSNIYYHLGLAHYLKGGFAAAADAFDAGMASSRVNDDMLVATSYWLLLSRLRSGYEGRNVLDAIRPQMDVIENHDYHRLLLLWKGDVSEQQVRAAAGGGAVSDATIGYGLAIWKLLNGETGAAQIALREIVRGPNWAAFGFIAAEAELAR